MNLDQETIQESKKLIKSLKDEGAMDLVKPTQEVEAEILQVWDEYEKHRRLRHTKETSELFYRLENLYVKQASIRGDQMKREEAIKVKIRILHSPFTDRWLRDLTEDVRDLMAKRSVHGQEDSTQVDRETGEKMILVTQNLRSVSNILKKVQASIVKIRESIDRDSLDNIEKVYQAGHESAGSRLKDETQLATHENFEDLVRITKEEPPRFTEMTLAEMVATASAEKMIGVLESLKKNF